MKKNNLKIFEFSKLKTYNYPNNKFRNKSNNKNLIIQKNLYNFFNTLILLIWNYNSFIIYS